MSMSEQDKWDDQIELNRSATWRSAHMIANKMEKCANNPRNGGSGWNDTHSPYSIDDEDDARWAADTREGGMRSRWR